MELKDENASITPVDYFAAPGQYINKYRAIWIFYHIRGVPQERLPIYEGELLVGRHAGITIASAEVDFYEITGEKLLVFDAGHRRWEPLTVSSQLPENTFFAKIKAEGDIDKSIIRGIIPNS